MWKVLLPQVRQYFFLGKGYAIDPADLYLTGESMRRGLAQSFEGRLCPGLPQRSAVDSYSIRSLWIDRLLWFLTASLRVLYRNYRYGDPSRSKLNTVLLSYFAARAVFYFIGFGSLHSDLPMFAGLIGLSVALNGGVQGPPARVATFARAGLTTADAV